MTFLPEPDEAFEAKQKEAFLAFLQGKRKSFNLWAQDPGRWGSLEARVPGLLMESCGGMAPLQAEGYIRGYPFYFRYEECSADISVGKWGAEEYPYGKHQAQWVGFYSIPHAENFMTLTPEQFEEVFVGTLRSLKVAPFLWAFRGKETCYNEETGLFESTGLDTVYSFLDYSAEEAYVHFHELTPFLVERMGEETARSALFAKELHPVPMNSDNRAIPPPPNFLA